MKIRDHYFVNERCVHCGAEAWHRVEEYYRKRNMLHPGIDNRQCVERNVDTRGLRPEPARRVYAVDDGDTISRRIAELETDRLAAINRTDLAEATASYWAATTHEQERIAYAAMRAAGAPPAYGEDE